MKTMTLYRFTRPDGGVNVSPNKPNGEYTTLVRLIADEGMVLIKDGCEPTYCIDTESTEGWSEIVDTSEEMNNEEINNESL